MWITAFHLFLLLSFHWPPERREFLHHLCSLLSVRQLYLCSQQSLQHNFLVSSSLLDIFPKSVLSPLTCCHTRGLSDFLSPLAHLWFLVPCCWHRAETRLLYLPHRHLLLLVKLGVKPENRLKWIRGSWHINEWKCGWGSVTPRWESGASV